MDSKRLRNAIIITVACTALFGTGLGFVSAAGEDVPDEFFVGHKRIGDEVIYEIEFDGHTWQEKFSWGTPKQMIDDDGMSRLANILTIQTNGPQSLNWNFAEPTDATAEVAYPLNNFDSISGRMLSTQATQQSGTLTNTGFASLFSYKSYFPVRASCGIFEVPETIHRDDKIPTRPCAIANTHTAGLEPIALENGQLLLEGDAAWAAADMGQIRAWFGGGIPYPMRMETQDYANQDGEIVIVPGSMKLISYTAGTVPLLQAPSAKITEFSEEVGPRLPWGPSGTFAGFSAQDGYNALKSLGHITNEHFVAAELTYFDMDDYQETNWTVVLSDGRKMTVAEREETSTLATLLGPTTSIRISNQGTVPNKPSVSDLPDEIPTIASLLAFHDAYADMKNGLIGYGFEFTCYFGDCADTRMLPIGGASSLSSSSDLLVGSEISMHVSLVSKNLLGYVNAIEASGEAYSELAIGTTSAPEPAPEEAHSGVSPWITPSASTVATFGFLGTVIGAMYYFKPAFFGLFSRLHKDDLLTHPARAQLMQTIEESPGLHLQALLRETEMAGGTLRHHLDILAKNEYVKRVDAGGRSCYFPKGAIDHRAMVQQAAVGTGSARAIYDLLQTGPLTVGEIAEGIGLGRSTVSHHIAKLQRQGILVATKQGRQTMVSLGTIAS